MPLDVLQVQLDAFLVFVLILTRLSGLVMTAPIFGSRSIPMRIRAYLAIGLALIVTPLYSDNVEVPPHLLGLLVMLGREILLGVAIGLAIMILFTGLQLAGQIIGQISGMSLADVFDPTFQTSVPVFTQLLDIISLSVFVSLGGHRQVLGALLDSFRQRPPGSDAFPTNLASILNSVVADSFAVGIRAAAPVMVALLLSVLILGLISRTLPQLNIIAVGFSLNSMIMLITLSLSIGTIAWVLQDQAQVVLNRVRQSLELRVESQEESRVESRESRARGNSGVPLSAFNSLPSALNSVRLLTLDP